MSSPDRISFTKMQGAGNDFVVIDNRSGSLSKQQLIELAPRICNRKYGVGSDGILALMSPEMDHVDYTMFYRNPDGSDAGMCGNGARCIALFAYSLGFGETHRFNVHDKIYKAAIKDEETVCIEFPMTAAAEALTIDGEKIYKIYPGTEHIVIIRNEEKLENEDSLKKEGQQLRYHECFKPKGTNVNFILGTGESQLKLQTYERGVEDLTLACGTGAIASALIWHYIGDRHSAGKSIVETKGGTLVVYFSFDTETESYSNIKLEGPTHFVFKGNYIL